MGSKFRGDEIMALNKKSSVPRQYIPYQNNDNVYVAYELEFKNDVIKPGDKFKKKFDRDTYVFLRLAHHIKNDSTWVDALSETNKSWHSIRIEEIHRVIRPKKRRRKRIAE
jgi:hypothetical protein